MSSQGFLLETRNAVKSFGGVHALKGIDFQLRSGQVHVLLGENGAGKSTLIKILSGVYKMDEGELLLEGQPITIASPREARDLGLHTIHQELCLLPHLTVAENISLGSEPAKKGFINKNREIDQASRLLKRLGLEIDP